MIIDSRQGIKYDSNTEALQKIDINVVQKSRPHYEPIKGHEKEFIAWFNYEAVKESSGKYRNPSPNKYLNIYDEFEEGTIQEIIPDSEPLSHVNDSILLLVFKKLDKKVIYFYGIYAVEKREGRSVFLRRISYTYDSQNVYVITPTEGYYKLLEDADSKNKPYYDILSKLITEYPKAINRDQEANEHADNIEDKADEELNRLVNSSESSGYKYVEPKIEKNERIVGTYKRNKQVAFNAISINGCQCDIDPSHKLFFKQDNTKYIEVHHIIPMSAQRDFSIPLDREENIACLCPSCHREIHYGRNKRKMVEKLLSEKEEKLKNVGLEISIEKLIEYYE